MNYLSVCSGIEAASVAWHPLGWNCVGVSEIEPFPSALLTHHYPSVPNFGDMTKFKEWKINGTVDLLVGGTPCQSFSVAGLRQGLKDPRGNLMLTFLAIAEHFKPKWILWENVPGVLSSNGGKDFGSFLGGLGELGYGFAYRVLDAQWCRTHRHPRAVPQRRRRVFVVGCAGDHISAAKVLFKRESLQRYSAPRRATRQGTSADVAGCFRSGGDGGMPSSRGEHLVADVATVDARNNFDRGDSQHLDRLIPCWWDGNNTAGTLTKSNANGAQRMPDKDNFGAVLQPVAMAAFTKSKRAQSKTDNETWVEGVVAPTQNAFDVGDVRATTVAIPIMPQAMQAEGWRVGKENQDGRGNGLGVGKDGDPCPTLDRSAVPAVAIQGTVIGRQDHNEPQGSGCSDSGEMFTLNSTDVHAVAMINMQGAKSNACIATDGSSFTLMSDSATTHAVAVAPTITATNDPSRSPQSSEITQQVAAVHASTMQVRRLTPTECERLQGFPDGWTAIPWKKKSADDCPDGPRYKALGNSMAVNCIEWLGERIQAVTNGN
jgi:DNA (cytosine-5)-methyltransferase 1